MIEVFTIVAGDYAPGAAALCNSLAAAKLGGIVSAIHIGVAGEPDWTLTASAPIVVHRLPPGDRWAGNHKPALIEAHARGAFLFIDADCIVTGPALIETVAAAVADGPVLCAEGIVPSTDIRRQRWRRARALSLGLAPATATAGASDIYYNSGFIGGDIRRDRRLLEDWRRLIDTALTGSGGLYETRDFPMPDQDCLNAVIQDEAAPFSCISPPDVWYAASPASPFLPVGRHETALLHCTGPHKPWRLSAIPPRAPNPYERAWHHFVYEDARWVRCPAPLKRSVRSWLGGKPWGRRIAQARRLAQRLAGR
jgi:hypothetical protein